MNVAPAECYLTRYMACFQQLGHFELLRDRMLHHFSEAAQQQQLSEDDFQIPTCSSFTELVEPTVHFG